MDNYVDTVMDQLPPRYFSAFSEDDRQLHRHILTDLGPDTAARVLVKAEDDDAADPGQGSGLVRLTVIAFDVPGLFALLSGGIAVHGGGIISGVSCTARPETVSGHRPLANQRRRIIDEFRLHAPEGAEPEIWCLQLEQYLQQALERLIGGDQQDALRLKQELAQKAAEILAPQEKTSNGNSPLVTTSVSKSETGTRIAVTSQDTPFFLYSAAVALSLHGVSIEGVEIFTEQGMVKDVFEIVDAYGRPIEKDSVADQLQFSLAFTKQFTYHLSAAPDPFAALQRFDTLMQSIMDAGRDVDMRGMFTDPEIQQELARLLGASDFLWEDFICRQQDQILPLLSRDSRGQVLSLDQAEVGLELDKRIAAAEGTEAKVQALNEFKDSQIYHIDVDHILHPDLDFFFLSRRLVRLAEEVVRVALEISWNEHTAKYGFPRTAGGLAVPYAVFGLGKLGGEALGYASDLEVLCVYADAGQTDGEKSVSNRDFFERLFSKAVRYIHARKEGIFQIDLRLRPHGEDGPLACSLDSFVSYYQPGGGSHSYERLALIRLRYVAGDRDLGARVERLRDELVYQSDSVDLEELREMRAKQLVHRSGEGALNGVAAAGRAYNAKFSPGSLVDLEYNVQLLQIEHAGEHPELRTPRLHEALAGLRRAGALDSDEVGRLIDAYRFFRHLINGLRMLRGNAKDLFMPEKESPEFSHLARRIGYRLGSELIGNISPSEQLYVDFQHHTAEVRRIIERHLGRGAIPGHFVGNVLDMVREDITAQEAKTFFAGHGFREPERAWSAVRSLHSACPQAFLRVIVLAFDVLEQQPDPDLALLHWIQLVEQLDVCQHFEILASQPGRMEILFGLFGVSRFLSDILIQHPLFFDWVTEPETVSSVRSLEQLQIDLRQQVEQGRQEGQKFQDVLRLFRKREMVRIGTRDLQIAVPLKYTLREISNLAQAVVAVGLEEVWAQQSVVGGGGAALVVSEAAAAAAEPAKSEAAAPAAAPAAYPGGACPERFCVLAFGKFGGEELNYSSDIDLLAIYEPAGSRRNQDEERVYTNVVRGLTGGLSEYTGEGYAYRVDLRLRPFGASGDLVWSAPRILEYYSKDASLWEYQALIKLRPVAGNLEIGYGFLREVRKIMARTCSGENIVENIRQLREEAVQQYRARQLRLLPSAGSALQGLSAEVRTLLAEMPAMDIKNGVGGIRDIEFLVQGLQMMHCSGSTDILHGGTLDALRQLAKIEVLPQLDAVELAEQYVFLRRLEHLLQIFEDRQVHSLPWDERALERLARKASGPGSSIADFLRQTGDYMRNVRRLYDKFLQKCS